jgi:hypothetical protein
MHGIRTHDPCILAIKTHAPDSAVTVTAKNIEPVTWSVFEDDS